MTIPKTANELYSAMCAALPSGPETVRSTSVTGEPYVERCFMMDDRKDAEEVTCAAAWRFFSDDLASRLYMKESGTTLYWRTKPEFCYFDEDTGFDRVDGQGAVIKRSRLYLRYLISDAKQRVTADV